MRSIVFSGSLIYGSNHVQGLGRVCIGSVWGCKVEQRCLGVHGGFQGLSVWIQGRSQGLEVEGFWFP